MKPICLKQLAIILAACLTVAAPVSAAETKSATLATHAVGSLYNAIGTGIATVVSRHTAMIVRVQPFAGPPAWLPSMNSGETDMGVLTSADAVTSYRGVILYKKPYKNTRILVVGGALQLSFYVPREAPIETVADLKGKKNSGRLPGHADRKAQQHRRSCHGRADLQRHRQGPRFRLAVGRTSFHGGAHRRGLAFRG